jgi:hypothetical protein
MTTLGSSRHVLRGRPSTILASAKRVHALWKGRRLLAPFINQLRPAPVFQAVPRSSSSSSSGGCDRAAGSKPAPPTRPILQGLSHR